MGVQDLRRPRDAGLLEAQVDVRGEFRDLHGLGHVGVQGLDLRRVALVQLLPTGRVLRRLPPRALGVGELRAAVAAVRLISTCILISTIAIPSSNDELVMHGSVTPLPAAFRRKGAARLVLQPDLLATHLASEPPAAEAVAVAAVPDVQVDILAVFVRGAHALEVWHLVVHAVLDVLAADRVANAELVAVARAAHHDVLPRPRI
mmetsp:Transcript_52948/g.172320  ORF Transcript_52948/g.172320 Transcript_52948/m.172320 type:complete len:204 (-) Transcript_52948:414-1025(-)